MIEWRFGPAAADPRDARAPQPRRGPRLRRRPPDLTAPTLTSCPPCRSRPRAPPTSACTGSLSEARVDLRSTRTALADGWSLTDELPAPVDVAGPRRAAAACRAVRRSVALARWRCGRAAASAATGASCVRAAVRHVFVINLENKGYDADVRRRRRRRRTSPQTLRGQGRAAQHVLRHRHNSPADNYIARSAARRRTRRRRPTASSTPTSSQAGDRRATARRSAAAACTRSRCTTSPTSSTAKGLTWRATWRTWATPCRHPPLERGATTPRRPRSATSTPRGTTRSCTSTRSSTRRDCAPARRRLTQLATRPALDRDDAEPALHHARTCATTATTRRASTASPAA